MSDPVDDLAPALHARAHDVTSTTLTLDDVRDRARQIRRRRAAAAVAAVAVVATLVVPVSLLVDGDRARAPEPAPAPSASSWIDPHQPGIPTLQEGVIIYADGPRVPLQLLHGEVPDGFAEAGGDRWVVSERTRAGQRQVAVVDQYGYPQATYPLRGKIAAGADGVAWKSPDGLWTLLRPGRAVQRVRSIDRYSGDVSPDGSLVAARSGRGTGAETMTISDAHSGEHVASAGGDRISGWAWEDDEHLLFVRIDDDGTTVVRRLSADGVTTVLEGFHTAADAVSPPVILPSG